MSTVFVIVTASIIQLKQSILKDIVISLKSLCQVFFSSRTSLGIFLKLNKDPRFEGLKNALISFESFVLFCIILILWLTWNVISVKSCVVLFLRINNLNCLWKERGVASTTFNYFFLWAFKNIIISSLRKFITTMYNKSIIQQVRARARQSI